MIHLSNQFLKILNQFLLTTFRKSGKPQRLMAILNFEEFGELVYAVDIHQVLTVYTEEKIRTQLLLQAIQRLADDYGISRTMESLNPHCKGYHKLHLAMWVTCP